MNMNLSKLWRIMEDRGAWCATVLEVTKSWTWLSNWIMSRCHWVQTFQKCTCFCCSVTQSCPTLCDPVDCNTPGFPVLHHLLELAQTHVCWSSDVIQPSHPLSSPSPPAFNLSQNQGLFQWLDSSHQVAMFRVISCAVGNVHEAGAKWTRGCTAGLCPLWIDIPR